MAGLPAKKWSMSSPWNEVGIHPFHMESIWKIAGSVKTSPSALEFSTNLVIADGFGYLSHDFTMHVIPILKFILLTSTFKNLCLK